MLAASFARWPFLNHRNAATLTTPAASAFAPTSAAMSEIAPPALAVSSATPTATSAIPSKRTVEDQPTSEVTKPNSTKKQKIGLEQKSQQDDSPFTQVERQDLQENLPRVRTEWQQHQKTPLQQMKSLHNYKKDVEEYCRRKEEELVTLFRQLDDEKRAQSFLLQQYKTQQQELGRMEVQLKKDRQQLHEDYKQLQKDHEGLVTWNALSQQVASFGVKLDSVNDSKRDLDELKEILSQHLKCPICYNALRDPVMTKNCGHTFCRGCLKEHIATDQDIRTTLIPTCPTCRRSIHKGLPHTTSPYVQNFALNALLQVCSENKGV